MHAEEKTYTMRGKILCGTEQQQAIGLAKLNQQRKFKYSRNRNDRRRVNVPVGSG
jgi:hypothetical protein